MFSAMAIPACLWRRTGEIYKGNKEFATLIDVSVDDLRDVTYMGKTGICYVFELIYFFFLKKK